MDQLTPYTGRPSYGRPVTPLRAVEPEPALRVGDLERATACDALAEHFAAGRLDPAELDDRLARAMAARSRDDLRALFADLAPRRTPSPAADPAPGPPTSPEPRSRNDLAPVLATVVVLSLLLAGGMLLVLGAYSPALFVAALVGGAATAVAGGCATALARSTVRRR